MVVEKFHLIDATDWIIEAIRFNRINWKSLRKFAGDKIHSLKIPTCRKQQATCQIQSINGDLTVDEGDWIVKYPSGEINLITAAIMRFIYKKIDG